MSLIGYARVSSKDQSLDIQIEKLQAYGCQKIYKEKVSGVDANRPELIKCKEYLREGDTLVITKLDRMARSSLDLGNIIKRFEEEDVNLVVLDQKIDTTTSYGKLTFHILASVAEFENEIRKERQREGIEKAKQKGVKIGRPVTIDDKLKEKLIIDIVNDKPTAQILKDHNLARSTYFAFKKKHEKEIKNQKEKLC